MEKTEGNYLKERNEYPSMLTAKDVAEIARCSLRSAYDVMNEKEFPLIKLGGKKRVFRDEFYRWLESKQRPTA